jgi:hypothetical protein
LRLDLGNPDQISVSPEQSVQRPKVDCARTEPRRVELHWEELAARLSDLHIPGVDFEIERSRITQVDEIDVEAGYTGWVPCFSEDCGQNLLRLFQAHVGWCVYGYNFGAHDVLLQGTIPHCRILTFFAIELAWPAEAPAPHYMC